MGRFRSTRHLVCLAQDTRGIVREPVRRRMSRWLCQDGTIQWTRNATILFESWRQIRWQSRQGFVRYSKRYGRACVRCANVDSILRSCRQWLTHTFYHDGVVSERFASDQPILWSKIDNETKSGLGIQKTFGKYVASHMPHAFAFHKKQQLEGQFKADVETCKRERGCYAYYDSKGVFQIGCNHTAKAKLVGV